ncbi:MAG: hypothetical protein ACK5MT_06265 [Actinomycetales bacterium]
MSDLQCPATFLLLAEDDDSGVPELAGARVAALHAWPGTSSTAHSVAADLGLVCVEHPADEEPGAVLIDLADLFRGETVLAVIPHRWIDALLPSLDGWHAGWRPARPGLIRIDIDADGQRLVGAL